MALTSDQMKLWIEELIGKIRVLEEENKLLKSQGMPVDGDRSLGQVDENFHTRISDLEQKVKNIESGQQVGLTKMNALELENQTLKLKILELTMEIEGLGQEETEEFESDDSASMSSDIDMKSPTVDTSPFDTEEDNPPLRKRRRIESDGGAPVVSSDKEMTTVIVNPLEIEEILRMIMGHVKPLDLLKCRQVSKLWRKAVQNDFQERLTFRVNSNDDVKLFLLHSEISFPKFRCLKVNLEDRPPPDNLKGMVRLFARHGQFLHKLQLNFGGHVDLTRWTLEDFRYVFLSSLEQIRDLRINMLCHFFHENQMFYPYRDRAKRILPNLTTLNIRVNCYGCRFDHVAGRSLVSLDLLGMAPNVRTLHWLVDYGIPRRDESKNFIHCLLLSNPIKLENLFMDNAITEDVVRSIAESNFNLKQLYLENFRGFKLHFFSTPTAEGKKCEVTPKNGANYNGRSGLALKTHLENLLTDTENMSCTKLLQVFRSATN